jgi:hypothetical protein
MQVAQQRDPDLQFDRVGVVPEKVAQLQGLFELLEEHFDAPAAAIEIGDAGGTPNQVVGQKHHLHHPPVNLHLSHDSPHHLGVILARLLVFSKRLTNPSTRAVKISATLAG